MWSTTDLAELAGTTVKAVRHYHRVGLLDEPERAANGYKKYGPAHLVRLLQIRSMSEVGLPLHQIGEVGRTEDAARRAVSALDEEIERTIRHLETTRTHLALLLHHTAPLGTPAAIADVAADLSEPDRTLLTVFAQVLDDRAMADVKELLLETDDAQREFEHLPADADPAVVDDLAGRLVASMLAGQERYPWTRDPGSAATGNRRLAERALGAAVAGRCNPAQLTTLQRVLELSGQLPAGR